MRVLRDFLIGIALLFMGGCNACISLKKPLEKTTEGVTVKPNDHMSIDADSITTRVPHFTYTSHMTVSLGKDEHHEDNHELISIVGQNLRLHLQKKIDDFHFFEIFRNGDDFLVKNQNGSWRNGSSNKPFYKNIIHDSFNLTSWLIEQFALAQLWQEKNAGGQSAFTLENHEISTNAPFLLNLAKKHAQFATLEKSSINAEVVMDVKTKIPTFARFDIMLIGQGPHWLKLNASMNFTLASANNDLAVPSLTTDEILTVPVNIAPRFNALMESKRGEK